MLHQELQWFSWTVGWANLYLEDASTFDFWLDCEPFCLDPGSVHVAPQGPEWQLQVGDKASIEPQWEGSPAGLRDLLPGLQEIAEDWRSTAGLTPHQIGWQDAARAVCAAMGVLVRDALGPTTALPALKPTMVLLERSLRSWRLGGLLGTDDERVARDESRWATAKKAPTVLGAKWRRGEPCTLSPADLAWGWPVARECFLSRSLGQGVRHLDYDPTAGEPQSPHHSRSCQPCTPNCPQISSEDEGEAASGSDCWLAAGGDVDDSYDTFFFERRYVSLGFPPAELYRISNIRRMRRRDLDTRAVTQRPSAPRCTPTTATETAATPQRKSSPPVPMRTPPTPA